MLQRRLHQQRFRSHGFTLIELLVVISILALLVGILLPVLSSARASGRAAACLSNLRQIGVACYSYTNENKNYWPAERNEDTTAPPLLWYAPPSGAWHIKIVPFLPDERDNVANSYLLKNETTETVFHCPEWKDDPAGVTPLAFPSYGFSNYTLVEFSGITPSGESQLLLLDEVLRTSERKFTVDFNNQHPFQFPGFQFPLHFNTQQLYNPALTGWDSFRYDHNDALNRLYYDGHVESANKQQVDEDGQWVWAPRRPET